MTESDEGTEPPEKSKKEKHRETKRRHRQMKKNFKEENPWNVQGDFGVIEVEEEQVGE